jgi:hypothetical protein
VPQIDQVGQTGRLVVGDRGRDLDRNSGAQARAFTPGLAQYAGHVRSLRGESPHEER